MENITDIITGAFRGNTLDRLSSQLESSPATVERGIAEAVPLSVAGFAEQTQSEHGAKDLLARIRDGNYPQMDPAELDHVVSDPDATRRTVQSSGGFLGGFFGNKLNPMLDAVTNASGLSRASAGTLLGLIAPMLLGWVGMNVKNRGLNAHGLSQLLADEGRKVSGRLPAGFSSIFRGGAEHEYRDASPAREPNYRPRETEGSMSQRRDADLRRDPHPTKKRSRRLPAALLALAALAVIFSWWAFRRDERASTPEGEASRVAATQRETERPPEPRPQEMPPDGERGEQPPPEGTGPEGSEVQPVAGTDQPTLRDDARPLQAFFQEGQRPVPQRFLLEGLVYGTGEAAVASNAMLDETAQILMANPNARVRIEGHADHQGEDQANQMISQQRADAVKDYLMRQGVSGEQLTAVGLSSSHRIGSDDTPQGRSQNRRVELIVTQR